MEPESVNLDIDHNDPYLLGRALIMLGNYECQIRLSASKGTHMRIFGICRQKAYSIRTLYDDPYRVSLDDQRKKQNPRAPTSILWDKKNGVSAGVWVSWETHSLGQWLIRDTGRSLRDCIINLHTAMIINEWKDDHDLLIVQKHS